MYAEYENAVATVIEHFKETKDKLVRNCINLLQAESDSGTN